MEHICILEISQKHKAVSCAHYGLAKLPERKW